MVEVDQNLDHLRSVEELSSYRTEVGSRMSELNEEFSGVPFTVDAADEFRKLEDTLKEIDNRITELEYRKRAVENIAGRERNEE